MADTFNVYARSETTLIAGDAVSGYRQATQTAAGATSCFTVANLVPNGGVTQQPLEEFISELTFPAGSSLIKVTASLFLIADQPSSNAIIWLYIYKRDTSGTETLLLTGNTGVVQVSTDILLCGAPVPASIALITPSGSLALSETDRLVFKLLYADQRGSGSNNTLAIFVGDKTRFDVDMLERDIDTFWF